MFIYIGNPYEPDCYWGGVDRHHHHDHHHHHHHPYDSLTSLGSNCLSCTTHELGHFSTCTCKTHLKRQTSGQIWQSLGYQNFKRNKTPKKTSHPFSQLFKEKVHHRVNLHNGTNLDEFITLWRNHLQASVDSLDLLDQHSPDRIPDPSRNRKGFRVPISSLE